MLNPSDVTRPAPGPAACCQREQDVGSGTPNLGCSHPVLRPGQPGDRTRRGHKGARPGDRSPSQQGASLQGLAEGRDPSRFVWVGIKEVGIKERQKAVLKQQRSPRASGGSSKKVGHGRGQPVVGSASQRAQEPPWERGMLGQLPREVLSGSCLMKIQHLFHDKTTLAWAEEELASD